MRDRLISQYPDILESTDVGRRPNDAFFHAETHLLMRAARERGGSLEGLEIKVFVDNPMCWSCGRALPLIVRELGNPVVHFVGPTGRTRTLVNGDWRD